MGGGFFAIGGRECAELSDGGGDGFETKIDFGVGGVAAEAEAQAGLGFFLGEADGHKSGSQIAELLSSNALLCPAGPAKFVAESGGIVGVGLRANRVIAKDVAAPVKLHSIAAVTGNDVARARRSNSDVVRRGDAIAGIGDRGGASDVSPDMVPRDDVAGRR